MWLEWILVGKKVVIAQLVSPEIISRGIFQAKNMNPYLVWGICLAVVCLEKGLEIVYIGHISTLFVVIREK